MPNRDDDPALKAAGGAPRFTHTIWTSSPYQTAQLFRSVSYKVGEHPTLFHHRDGFYAWTGSHYA